MAWENMSSVDPPDLMLFPSIHLSIESMEFDKPTSPVKSNSGVVCHSLVDTCTPRASTPVGSEYRGPVGGPRWSLS